MPSWTAFPTAALPETQRPPQGRRERSAERFSWLAIVAQRSRGNDSLSRKFFGEIFKVSKPLHGKRALVTGASRGIGREVARVLCSAGAQVALNYRRSEQEARELHEELSKAGGRVITVRAD